jgi:PleD family two-component response regulator
LKRKYLPQKNLTNDQVSESWDDGILHPTYLSKQHFIISRGIIMSKIIKSFHLSDSKKWNVLLVDGEKFNHEILGMFLPKTDFTLHSAKNVREALEMLARTTVDYQMDGFGAA